MKQHTRTEPFLEATDDYVKTILPTAKVRGSQGYAPERASIREKEGAKDALKVHLEEANASLNNLW